VSTKAGGEDKGLVAVHWSGKNGRSDGEEDDGSSEDKGKWGNLEGCERSVALICAIDEDEKTLMRRCRKVGTWSTCEFGVCPKRREREESGGRRFLSTRERARG